MNLNMKVTVRNWVFYEKSREQFSIRVPKIVMNNGWQQAGRGYRRIHLERLAIIDSQREKKVLDLSPIAKMGFQLKKCFCLSTVTCHGCGTKPSSSNYEEKQSGVGTSSVKFVLCSDCLKDL